MSNHKRNFWIQHINAWQQSGLSRPEYLKAHQLSASQFSYYYRNHFHEAVQVVKDSKPTELVQVQVVEDQPVRATHAPCLTLSTPKGYRIELERALMQFCCRKCSGLWKQYVNRYISTEGVSGTWLYRIGNTNSAF